MKTFGKPLRGVIRLRSCIIIHFGPIHLANLRPADMAANREPTPNTSIAHCVQFGKLGEGGEQSVEMLNQIKHMPKTAPEETSTHSGSMSPTKASNPNVVNATPKDSHRTIPWKLLCFINAYTAPMTRTPPKTRFIKAPKCFTNRSIVLAPCEPFDDKPNRTRPTPPQQRLRKSSLQSRRMR